MSEKQPAAARCVWCGNSTDAMAMGIRFGTLIAHLHCSDEMKAPQLVAQRVAERDARIEFMEQQHVKELERAADDCASLVERRDARIAELLSQLNADTDELCKVRDLLAEAHARIAELEKLAGDHATACDDVAVRHAKLREVEQRLLDSAMVRAVLARQLQDSESRRTDQGFRLALSEKLLRESEASLGHERKALVFARAALEVAQAQRDEILVREAAGAVRMEAAREAAEARVAEVSDAANLAFRQRDDAEAARARLVRRVADHKVIDWSRAEKAEASAERLRAALEHLVDAPNGHVALDKARAALAAEAPAKEPAGDAFPDLDAAKEAAGQVSTPTASPGLRWPPAGDTPGEERIKKTEPLRCESTEPKAGHRCVGIAAHAGVHHRGFGTNFEEWGKSQPAPGPGEEPGR